MNSIINNKPTLSVSHENRLLNASVKNKCGLYGIHVAQSVYVTVLPSMKKLVIASRAVLSTPLLCQLIKLLQLEVKIKW